MKAKTSLILAAATIVSLATATSAQAAVDDAAAKETAKRNECLKCHAVDKAKKGPSYQKIAAKYKGKADAEDKVTKAITTGPKVKMDDGTQEDHRVIDTKDPKEIKNLDDWILSR